MGTDLKRMILTLAALKCNAINKSLEVDHCGIAVCDRSVCNGNSSCVVISLFLYCCLYLFVRYGGIDLGYLNTKILAKLYFRSYSNLCCEDERLACFCLNNIKAEGETMAALKGYKGVLDMALAHSRMDEKTLEAMWTAIREALPELREYFKAKGRLLGHENGLPFYDLFAPVGQSTRTYTVEEARALLLDLFGKFCPEMGEMMRTAFDEGWIDMFPREGKSGGAFCSGYYAKNISRVMTNFAGSASDVSTLAHELGHAFNNRMLHHKPIMMTETPMPLAETASTFNETLLISQLLKTATPEEELTLLDSCLTEQTQTMVDIYSRFLFEQKVVAAQADHALDVDELKETMLWAQEQSYGDGLDPEYRHPYMWACKSHYYSTGVHFYNFPYAFGGLFARGLYARYEKEGEAFVPVYCDLLSRFGSDTIANVTASVGIDVTTPDFWREAVESVLVQVRRFVELANQETAAK